MRKIILTTFSVLFAISVFSQQDNYIVTSGHGNGLKFWGNTNNYKIHMGDLAEHHYGPVTGYSIKMNMNSTSGRGWTWGVTGATPVAGLSNIGKFQIENSFTSKVGVNIGFDRASVAHPYGLWIHKGMGSTGGGGSGNYTSIQLVEKDWSGSHALLFNAYASSTQINGSLPTVGNTKYTNDVGNHSSGAGGIMFFGNGGTMSFYISPSSTGKNSNVNWGQAKMTIKRTGFIGIGQSDPLSKLHVVASARESMRLYESNTHDRYLSIWQGSGQPIIDAIGSGRMTIGYDEDVHLTINKNGTEGVSIGTSDLPTGYMFAVKGKTISEEIKVSLSTAWPDYVFTPSHNLQSLEEVETYINKNGHLPNIPSAAEVEEENGIELGEMNAKLLEKIEELTLHLIEKDKEISELKEMNEGLAQNQKKIFELLNQLKNKSTKSE